MYLNIKIHETVTEQVISPASTVDPVPPKQIKIFKFQAYIPVSNSPI